MTQTGVVGDFTIRQVVQAYWKWCKTNLATSTAQRRTPVLESFSQSVRANLKADALRGIHIEKWIEDFDKAKSPTTRGDYITLIKGMMKWAKGRGYIHQRGDVAHWRGSWHRKKDTRQLVASVLERDFLTGCFEQKYSAAICP